MPGREIVGAFFEKPTLIKMGCTKAALSSRRRTVILLLL